MAEKSTISWTDSSWSPLRARVKADAGKIARAKGYASLVQIADKMAGHVGHHCEHVSPECANCYSEANNARCLTTNGTGLPFDRRSRDLIDPIVDEKILLQPLKWRKPRRIFVESQSDLFGEWYTDDMIDQVFAVMALCPNHRFQVLTKRAVRMINYMCHQRSSLRWKEIALCAKDLSMRVTPFKLPSEKIFDGRSVALGEPWKIHAWPLPNVDLGVSAGTQKAADERIPLLLQTPAAVRWVSIEPQLEAVSLARWTEEGLECGYCKKWAGVESDAIDDGNSEDPGYLCPLCGEAVMHTPLDELLGARKGLEWAVIGGESGRGARPFRIEWAESLIKQCLAAGISPFLKQLGSDPIWAGASCSPIEPSRGKNDDPSQWPELLRVQEYPA